MPETPPAPQLEYGVTPRIEPRRIARSVLWVLAVVAISFVGLRLAYYQYLYGDRDAVRRVLEDIPHSRVADVYGDHEGGPIPWEVYGAIVHLNGKLDRELHLLTPSASGLRSGKRIRVLAVGRYSFTAISPDGAWGQGIDIGRDGDFANFLPIQIKNVDDLARRFDEVVEAVAKMPPTGGHTAPGGTKYRYIIHDDRKPK